MLDTTPEAWVGAGQNERTIIVFQVPQVVTYIYYVSSIPLVPEVHNMTPPRDKLLGSSDVLSVHLRFVPELSPTKGPS